jgi:glycine/D-amino acid oxidase-like deaminating enzyme
VVVVGAGAFGAWTAWHLHKAGVRVVLQEMHGPAHSRASSGGESRIIRAGYGPREIYTRWSVEAIAQWQELDSSLFVECGALWITAAAGDPFAAATEAAFGRYGVTYDRLDARQLRRRFPQLQFADTESALYEPRSGALMARRAIQTLVRLLIREGVAYEVREAGVGDVQSRGAAGHTVFACGPWLPKLFPELLGRRIVPTRQDVLFFGLPPGSTDFGADRLPCWIDVASGMYGLPDLEGRGFKLADDARGPEIDPDTENRIVAPASVQRARQYLSSRAPALANAPLVESRVCQYENTDSGDYLIDRHPDFSNVWLAGGGSGHGFKHGPAVGKYLADLILGRGAEEPRFGLASKKVLRDTAIVSSL